MAKNGLQDASSSVHCERTISAAPYDLSRPFPSYHDRLRRPHEVLQPQGDERYSTRNAESGSTLAALRAGNTLAMSPTLATPMIASR